MKFIYDYSAKRIGNFLFYFRPSFKTIRSFRLRRWTIERLSQKIGRKEKEKNLKKNK